MFQVISEINGDCGDSVVFLKIGFGPIVLGAGIGVTESPDIDRVIGKATFGFSDAESINDFIQSLEALRDATFPGDD